MAKKHTSILFCIVAIMVSMTTMGTAAANSYLHPANSEKGYVIYPDHFKSEKTREQVKAETAEFLKNGGAEIFREGAYPPPDASKPSGTTRQQVIDELVKESPEERKARLDLYRG